jgi:hypothetical protein
MTKRAADVPIETQAIRRGVRFKLIKESDFDNALVA